MSQNGNFKGPGHSLNTPVSPFFVICTVHRTLRTVFFSANKPKSDAEPSTINSGDPVVNPVLPEGTAAAMSASNYTSIQML